MISPTFKESKLENSFSAREHKLGFRTTCISLEPLSPSNFSGYTDA